MNLKTYNPLTEAIASKLGLQPKFELHDLMSSSSISINISVNDCTTVFTSGMSEFRMNVTEQFSEYQHAELFIQLPSTWSFDHNSLKSDDNAWPFDLLKRISRFPINFNSSLGGPFFVFPNDSPEKKFAEHNEFCGVLVIAEHSLLYKGKLIQLYRLCPLFWEEVLLERNVGMKALLNAMDEKKVPFVVDACRENVGLLP